MCRLHWTSTDPCSGGSLPGRARCPGTDRASTSLLGSGAATSPGSAHSPPGTAFPRRHGSPTIHVDSADEAAERAKSAGGVLRDGPLDALPAGRLAVLADPAGALVCVWEAGAREGAQLVNEPQAWALSLLRTTDPEGSKAFYGSVFGWQPETFGAPEGHLTLWRLPGYVGGVPQQTVPRDVVAIMTPTGGDGLRGAEESHWSVDFWVDDADATADQATSLGGKVIVPPHNSPGFRGAVLADPQGAAFSVSKLTTDVAIPSELGGG